MAILYHGYLKTPAVAPKLSGTCEAPGASQPPLAPDSCEGTCRSPAASCNTWETLQQLGHFGRLGYLRHLDTKYAHSFVPSNVLCRPLTIPINLISNVNSFHNAYYITTSACPRAKWHTTGMRMWLYMKEASTCDIQLEALIEPLS